MLKEFKTFARTCEWLATITVVMPSPTVHLVVGASSFLPYLVLLWFQQATTNIDPETYTIISVHPQGISPFNHRKLHLFNMELFHNPRGLCDLESNGLVFALIYLKRDGCIWMWRRVKLARFL